MLGCCDGAGAGTSSTAGPAADPAWLQRSDAARPYLWTFDGHQNFGGNFVTKAIMQGLRFNGDGKTFNPFGTVNIGGTIIFDAAGEVGTYTVAADCTGTLSIADSPTSAYTSGPVHGRFDSGDLPQSCRHRSE